jgi:hypothetical protein
MSVNSSGRLYYPSVSYNASAVRLLVLHRPRASRIVHSTLVLNTPELGITKYIWVGNSFEPTGVTVHDAMSIKIVVTNS